MHFRHIERTQPDVKNRVASVLLIMCALLVNIGCAGEALAQEKLARVGVLTYWSIDNNPWWEPFLEIFRQTLADRGWIEGKTVSFEYRSANNDPSQLANAAEALVGLKVDVIWAPSAPSLRAAYAATRTIPIITGDYTTDPIAQGYIESYARPGGNVTGVFLDTPEFSGKWVELLKGMVPDLSRVAVLWDPAPGANHLKVLSSIAQSLDIELQVHEVRKPDDIDMAFSALRGQLQAVIILPSPMIYTQSPRLATLALKHRLPATAFAREFATAGGLIAYGPLEASTFNRQAVLAAKILDGSNPAELPVERPTRFKLVVNLITAKALGISVPQSILFRADEVIR